ncbi:MAG TPA: hypothetical protein RMH99_05110 [Sandaracinaceae bacterium LLY-WYZ-13_1]|nr:hypothetical protein [Sandaracinaceae bacterium LLY-WYZ-13_1]
MKASDDSADLLTTIETQIIPRLLLAERPAAPELEACPEVRLPPTEDEVAAFATLAVAQDVEGLLETVAEMSNDGLSPESILLDLVGAASRLLGAQWEDDERSFSEVTLGTGSLQRVVAVLGRRYEQPRGRHGLVALISVFGEQHSLPLHLLGELCRRNGWSTHVRPGIDEDELLDLVANDPVVMVGVTCKDTRRIDDVAALLADVARTSQNPDILLVVGGSPDLVEHAPAMGAKYCRSMQEAVHELSRRVST